jgi:hypothetical protein
LRKQAQAAITLRKQWEAAQSIPDVRQRVVALFPYLGKDRLRFYEATEKELQRIGTVAGDYLADHLENMSNSSRSLLLSELHLYRSERLHQALVHHLDKQRKRYEKLWVADYLEVKSGASRQNILPQYQEITQVRGELSSGLHGLANFRQQQDLFFIRDLATWSIQYQLWQVCRAALMAFRYMPAEANLPVIAAIGREHRQAPQGYRSLSNDIVRALSDYKYPETVLILVQFLEDKDTASEAKSILTKIVGKDLGPEPAAWLGWYKQLKSFK